MRALVLSGGAFRGAVQIPVIEYLSSVNKYDFIYGVSVGALNGIMLAQNKLPVLRAMWEDVDSINKFLKPKWYWPFNGLYSMKPLRKLIENETDLNNIQIPFAAGVVSLTDGEYYNIDTRYLNKNKDLWDAIEASSSIAGLMVTPEITIDNRKHIGSDGGFRNIIPVPPPGNFKFIDVVTCTSLERIRIERSIKTGIDKAARGIEIMEAEIFQKDIDEIRRRNHISTKVTIYAPTEDTGPSFKASKELIQMRFKLGEEAIHNPVDINFASR